MGYYYPNCVSSRKELADYLCEQRTKYTADRRYFCGNVLWILWVPTDEARSEGLHAWIECNLLTCYRKDGFTEWGYKPMAEAAGPFYYSCPKAFLCRAPVEDQQWRDCVESYWEKRKERQAAKRQRRAAVAN